MSEWTVMPAFEEQVRQSFAVPEIRPEFINRLERDLLERAKKGKPRGQMLFGLRPAAAIAMVVLTLVILTTLIVGPQQVYAGFKKLLGYIPGIGLVDQESTIRVLTEPVSQVRDGITVAVNQAFLLETETRLEYGVSGVSLSAYPGNEAVTGCFELPYLRLPDGTQLDIDAPVPADIYQVTFVLPCIFNTLPDTTPTGWELPLTFVDAPDNLIILPVQAVLPSPGTAGRDEPLSGVETQTADVEANASVSVDSVIETQDGYILLGSVRSLVPEGSWLQIIGPMVIHDAQGNTVRYGFPEDIQPPMDIDTGRGGYSWAVQIDGAGLAFPLKFSFNAMVISEVEIEEPARLVFDTGLAPQPGQVWDLNQDIDIGGFTIRLLSVTAMEDSFSFSIDPGPDLVDVNVAIDGFQALAGGGGGAWGGAFTRSMVYADLPAGSLTLVFDRPTKAEPVENLQTEWQPEEVREFQTAISEGVCWDSGSYPSIPELPDGLDGLVVVAQVNPQMQLVESAVDGSGSRVLAVGSVHGAVSLDGSALAYADERGIGILDLETGAEETIAGMSGISQHWSPDGSRIAVVRAGEAYGIFVVGRDGTNPLQLSNLGYESIAGWSPDGTALYYTIPGSSENGFDLREVDVETGGTDTLFVLKNSSLKAPYPAVSPDGFWIAYRGRDNSSLYIMGMDGSPARLVLDAPALAVSGIAWERAGHLLGVSLITADNQEGEVILLAPDSCETYRLPGVRGALRGLWIR
ncbi:MAG: hypothetical protein JXA25_07150 [Anaerolineales bacterium]|nr:hypothetical protein [Anaerolineales bacterium]